MEHHVLPSILLKFYLKILFCQILGKKNPLYFVAQYIYVPCLIVK